MPYVEDRGEFLKRHGGDAVPIKSASTGQGDALLLADGAMVQFATLYYPERFIEPPHNLKERLLARRRYHTVKLRLFEDAFRQLKAALLPLGDPDRLPGDFVINPR